MKIIIIARTTFDVVEFNGIKNIAFNGTAYTITKADNSTVSYNAADYLISFKW